MKSMYLKFASAFLILSAFFACKKSETVESNGYNNDIANAEMVAVSDSISSVATMQVKDKKFIKTASVNMEVKDVYEATVFIEKSVKELGGFVTQSNLQSNVISDETFNISDENAIMVKKFQTENSMEVRVPTLHLGEFLENINERKLFLNSRIISAEDVTANMKYAELEAKRISKTGENISTLKNNGNKVDRSNDNMNEANFLQLQNMNIADNIKYSTIRIFIKETKFRIAEIPVTNSRNIDNQYKFNFFYDAKNAFVEGFYLIQIIAVGLIRIWPIVCIGVGVFYFLRKRKSIIKK